MTLPVALSGREDHGTGILEHRHEVGYDDGLGEQVLGGAEEGRTLPSPSTFVEVVEATVAGP